MPLGDGTGPAGRGPGTGRRLGRCFGGSGFGRRAAGAGLGMTALAYVARDLFSQDSLIRAGVKKLLGAIVAGRKRLPASDVIEAEFKEIEEIKEKK